MRRKISLLISILLMAIFLSGCGIFNLNGWLLPNDIEFIKVIENLRTPQEISDYMMNNFVYEQHAFYAPDPYMLWKTGKGDCNDMSTWGCFVANYHNYETWQIKIYYLNDPFWQHWIAIYKENDGLSFSDNQYYSFYLGKTYFDSFREIVEFDSEYFPEKEWAKFIVYDYSGEIISNEVNK